MATTRIIDRQLKKTASAFLGIAHIGAGNTVTFAVRPGTLVLSVFAQTITAFDGTTNTATIGDGTTTFVNAVDIKSTGAETAANVPKYYPTGGTITVTLAQTGAATVGELMVGFEYIIRGNGDGGIEE